jgi:hypothetical protein
MTIFGRKKSAMPTVRRTDRPDTLDVGDAADVDWIKRSGDPLIWHAAALACLIFRGDKHGLLEWLIEQPNIDRVTAAAILLHRSNGVRRLKGESVEYVQMDEMLVERLIDRLCALDTEQSFSDHGIGLGEGWETERVKALSDLSDNPRAPVGILRDPIDRQTVQMPYLDLGEGDLFSEQHMRETMPFLFD